MIKIVDNFISNWLKDILVVFIVVSFLEIILPKGKMKRFVHFIIGLLIILVIISPFTDLESLQYKMNMYAEEFITGSDNQRIIDEQENKIREVFIDRLSQEVRNYVESNSNYELIDINISIGKEEDTILIHAISLTIRKKKDTSSDGIKIDQVEIKEDNNISQYKDYNNLKTLISDYLEIDSNIVYINEIN